MKRSKLIRKTASNASFTLLETVIAVAIMATMIAELVGLLGNTIYFSEYGANSTRAIWLAKRVLSQVEYQWRHRPFGDLTLESKDEIPFEDFPDYKYKLNITEWKLDLLEVLTGGGLSGDKEDEESQAQSEGENQLPGGEAAKGAFEAIFGDEPILQIAEVEVIWTEGATRNSVSVPYLLTNQKKIDEAIAANKAIYDDVLKKESGTGKNDKNNNNRGNGDNGPDGGSRGSRGGGDRGGSGGGRDGGNDGGRGTGAEGGPDDGP